VSNPESFIDEVTEEVRRDKLYALFRRYGWIGGLLVVLVVGGTAWREWSLAQAEARAQAFGDQVLEALDLGGAEERRAALEAIPATGGQRAVQLLLLASDPAEDLSATLAALDALIADASQPQSFRDLAVLRRVLVAGAESPLAERRSALEAIAVPGRPFRTVALEQLAYLKLEEGDTAGAIAGLQALTTDQEASQSLRQRAAQIISVLGGEPVTDAG
jgi:hypothetical protein